MNTPTTSCSDIREDHDAPPRRPGVARGDRPLLEVCTAGACRSVGGASLDFLAGATGICRVEPSQCLGLCAQAPAVLLQGMPYARMSAARLDALLQDVGACR